MIKLIGLAAGEAIGDSHRGSVLDTSAAALEVQPQRTVAGQTIDVDRVGDVVAGGDAGNGSGGGPGGVQCEVIQVHSSYCLAEGHGVVHGRDCMIDRRSGLPHDGTHSRNVGDADGQCLECVVAGRVASLEVDVISANG